jgi:uncharacterized protein with GYD domain
MVVIFEVPDNVSVSTLAIAIAAGGVDSKTTVLMSPEEGLEAMRRAGGTGYRPSGS